MKLPILLKMSIIAVPNPHTHITHIHGNYLKRHHFLKIITMFVAKKKFAQHFVYFAF